MRIKYKVTTHRPHYDTKEEADEALGRAAQRLYDYLVTSGTIDKLSKGEEKSLK